MTGTGALVRLILRRDRVRLTIWVYVIVGFVASTAYSFRGLYPTVAGRLAFGATIRANPTLLASTGRVFDADTIGGLTAWRVGGITAIVAALMSVLTVVRHTRAEEEAGRTELVGAGAVGRRAPLTAALLVVAGADVAAGALAAIVLVVAGSGVVGALAFGAAIAGAGVTFAAIGAVAAQLPQSSRTANAIALSALAAAFLLRAAGDASDGGASGFLSWLSPIGWAQQTRPYAHERWWVIALFAVVSVSTIRFGYALVARRDLGAGIRAGRPGPARATASLAGPLALAWRLQRGSWCGWAVGLLIGGAFIGGAARNIGSLVRTSPQLTDVITRLGGARTLTDTYLAAAFGLIGLVTTAYAVQAVLRARAEETALRAEPVLAAGVRRTAFLGGHLIVAALGAAALLAVTGLGAGLSYGGATGDLGQVPRLIAATLAQWPAAMVVAGVAVALFGLVPSRVAVAWLVLGVCALLGEIGPLLRLPGVVMDVSPFVHTPKLPGNAFHLTPVIALVAVAAVLTAAGIGGFRRRDIG